MKSVGLTLLLALGAPTLHAAELQCNKGQTLCVVDNHRNFTIGDRVGFFNTSGELVARGEVNAMRGDRRSVVVKKRHGQISRNSSLALLNTSRGASLQETYKIYKEPAKLTVGGSFGFSTVGIGSGSPGTEFQGYAQWRKWHDVELVARGTFISVDGEVTRTHDYIETQPISVNGFGASGGVGYSLRKNKTLGFRGEMGLGLMYISATVDGDSGLVQGHDFPSKVSNGFGLYGRGSAGAVVNMDKWHIHLDLVQSIIHDAMASTLAAGLSMDLK